MGRDGEQRVPPGRIVGRQRFGFEHVQHRPAELAFIQRGENVGQDLLPAAAGIDEQGTARQSNEQSGSEDALGGRRIR